MVSGGAATEKEAWIKIDPIQQPETGDPYIITGSTNIPADTAIVLKIYRYDGTLPTPGEKEIRNLPATFTYTMIVDGNEHVRNWSVDVLRPELLHAGNYRYVAAMNLMHDDDKLLAVASLPKPTVWAAVYPVPDRTVGDAVRISGTTNIPEGETVRVEVVAPASGQKPMVQQDATVAGGDDGTNTWTVVMDTAGFFPGMYTVNLNNVLHQQGPNFRLEPAADMSPWWIIFDPMQDVPAGEPLVISGATNIAAETPLDIVVQSSGSSVTGPDYPKAFTGTIIVKEGKNDINFWGIITATTGWREDQYEVIVTDTATGVQKRAYVNLRSPKELAAAPPAANHWITMNEVSYLAQGNYVFFGSTTVPPGTTIIVDVYRIDTAVSGTPEEFSPHSKIYSTSAVVIQGDGVNHWTATSALMPAQVPEKNVRYIAVAYPQEFSRASQVTRMVPVTGDWTTVDPIPDGVIGDLIPISGRTTYPPGEWITIEMHSVPWTAVPDQKPKEPVFIKEVMIEKGSVWSLVLDTADLPMDTYTIIADDAPYLSGPIFSLALPEERKWIAVDPVPLVTQNSTFTLSGTTGLDKGMQILIEILPQYFDAILANDSKGSYAASYNSISKTAKVKEGENGINTWSVPFDTRNWKTGVYVTKIIAVEVNAFTPDTEFELYPENSVPPKETQALGFGFIPVLFTAAVILMRR
jgi:hypothetical protein